MCVVSLVLASEKGDGVNLEHFSAQTHESISFENSQHVVHVNCWMLLDKCFECLEYSGCARTRNYFMGI